MKTEKEEGIEGRLRTLEEEVARIGRVVLQLEPLGPRTQSIFLDHEGDRAGVVERIVETLSKKKSVAPAASVPPVDRTARVLTSGAPVPADESHREVDSTGQQRGYVVLTAKERAKGFVRPVRTAYKHLVCGSITTMGLAIAETYARDPGFYGGTFCCLCRGHYPLSEFVWEGTGEQVGS